MSTNNNKKYIKMAKAYIDAYIRKNEYRKAFSMVIMVLERLDTDEKSELVDYYSKTLISSVGNVSHFDRRFEIEP
jgi:hypothetical protein